MKKKLLLMSLLVLFCLPTNVFALGKHINIDNSDRSNVLVIGDSRMDDLGMRVNSYKTKTRYSFNATRRVIILNVMNGLPVSGKYRIL